MHHFLSVCDWTKIQTGQKSLDQIHISGTIASLSVVAVVQVCKSWLVASVRVNGRCAQFNVKLHFLIIQIDFVSVLRGLFRAFDRQMLDG